MRLWTTREHCVLRLVLKSATADLNRVLYELIPSLLNAAPRDVELYMKALGVDVPRVEEVPEATSGVASSLNATASKPRVKRVRKETANDEDEPIGERKSSRIQKKSIQYFSVSDQSDSEPSSEEDTAKSVPVSARTRPSRGSRRVPEEEEEVEKKSRRGRPRKVLVRSKRQRVDADTGTPAKSKRKPVDGLILDVDTSTLPRPSKIRDRSSRSSRKSLEAITEAGTSSKSKKAPVEVDTSSSSRSKRKRADVTTSSRSRRERASVDPVAGERTNEKSKRPSSLDPLVDEQERPKRRKTVAPPVQPAEPKRPRGRPKASQSPEEVRAPKIAAAKSKIVRPTKRSTASTDEPLLRPTPIPLAKTTVMLQGKVAPRASSPSSSSSSSSSFSSDDFDESTSLLAMFGLSAPQSSLLSSLSSSSVSTPPSFQ